MEHFSNCWYLHKISRRGVVHFWVATRGDAPHGKKRQKGLYEHDVQRIRIYHHTCIQMITQRPNSWLGDLETHSDQPCRDHLLQLTKIETVAAVLPCRASPAARVPATPAAFASGPLVYNPRGPSQASAPSAPRSFQQFWQFQRTETLYPRHFGLCLKTYFEREIDRTNWPLYVQLISFEYHMSPRLNDNFIKRMYPPVGGILTGTVLRLW